MTLKNRIKHWDSILYISITGQCTVKNSNRKYIVALKKINDLVK